MGGGFYFLILFRTDKNLEEKTRRVPCFHLVVLRPDNSTTMRVRIYIYIYIRQSSRVRVCRLEITARTVRQIVNNGGRAYLKTSVHATYNVRARI